MKRIKGLYSMGGSTVPCFGKIEILNRTEKNVYASWEMRAENGSTLAGVSRNYFVGKQNVSENDLLPIIINNVINYRIGRKKIFTRVEIVDE
jgi:hypothetical protein